MLPWTLLCASRTETLFLHFDLLNATSQASISHNDVLQIFPLWNPAFCNYQFNGSVLQMSHFLDLNDFSQVYVLQFTSQIMLKTIAVNQYPSTSFRFLRFWQSQEFFWASLAFAFRWIRFHFSCILLKGSSFLREDLNTFLAFGEYRAIPPFRKWELGFI